MRMTQENKALYHASKLLHTYLNPKTWELIILQKFCVLVDDDKFVTDLLVPPFKGSRVQSSFGSL
jgi:hypothetical protein